MAGRGRGRGKTAVPNQPPKLGGGSTKDAIDELHMLVKDMSLDTDEKEMISVQELAVKACTSPERMEKVLETLYQRCYEDWRFSSSTASICCQLVSRCPEDDGKKFRGLILLRLQSDFKNKDKLRVESPQKFLGTVSFLCSIYGQLLDPEGKPFEKLTESVMESLEMLLDENATDDEMKCAAKQIVKVGKILQVNAEKIRLTGLRNKVKDKIIHAIGSEEVRTELIKVVEGFASEWKQHSEQPAVNK